MRNSLIPTVEDLENEALRILEPVSEDERKQWYSLPMTKALLALLEVERMAAFEELQSGPQEARARVLMAKAELVDQLREEIHAKLVEEPEND